MMTVVIVGGLPASGKSTWIAQHYPEYPVLDMEQLRLELAPEFHNSYDNWHARMHLAEDRLYEYAKMDEPPAFVIVEGIFWPHSASLNMLQAYLRGLQRDFPNVRQEYHLMDTPASLCKLNVLRDYLKDGDAERRDGRTMLIDIYANR